MAKVSSTCIKLRKYFKDFLKSRCSKKSHKNIRKSSAKGSAHSNTINLLVHDNIKAKFHIFDSIVQNLRKRVLGKVGHS